MAGKIFPIEDYDVLNASDVIRLLSGHDAVALRAIRRRELADKGRVTILRRVDVLLSRLPAVAAAPVPPRRIACMFCGTSLPTAQARRDHACDRVPLAPPEAPLASEVASEPTSARPWTPPSAPSQPFAGGLPPNVHLQAGWTLPPPPPLYRSAAKQPSWYRRPWVLSIAAVFVGLMLIGALAPKKDTQRIAARSTSSAAQTDSKTAAAAAAAAPTSEAPPPSTEPPQTTEPPPTTEDPAVAQRDAIVQWARDNGATMLSIEGTLQDVGNDASSLDTVSLAADCRVLADELGDAKAALPVPDADVNVHYAKALDYFSDAADACIAGAEDLDPSEISQSSTYFGLGADELSRATDALASFQ
jgi:hypothetical protein